MFYNFTILILDNDYVLCNDKSFNQLGPSIWVSEVANHVMPNKRKMN